MVSPRDLPYEIKVTWKSQSWFDRTRKSEDDITREILIKWTTTTLYLTKHEPWWCQYMHTCLQVCLVEGTTLEMLTRGRRSRREINYGVGYARATDRTLPWPRKPYPTWELEGTTTTCKKHTRIWKTHGHSSYKRAVHSTSPTLLMGWLAI